MKSARFSDRAAHYPLLVRVDPHRLNQLGHWAVDREHSETAALSWKPIDIAPRDGTRIVIAYRSPVTDEVCVSVSWWEEDEGWESDGEDAPELMEGLVPFAWVDFPKQ